MAQVLCPTIIGRQAELGSLRSALAGMAAGEGRCAVLVGEPGIGKSRLAREVAGWAAERGLPVAAGRAVPGSGAAAYRPITEALLQLFRAQSLPAAPDLERWLALLQPVLPTLIDHTPIPDAPPSLRGEAVLQLLRSAIPSGLTLVLEDLHWADPDTVAMVEYLADNLAGTPVLLVVTLRDSPVTAALEMARRQRGRPGVTHLALDRLDDLESEAMVRACRPDTGPEIVERIRQSSEGIPLLVEDLLATPGLPADFAATVKSRLAALPESQRQVVEAAAVLGRQFDWSLLPAMTGQDTDGVSEALAAGVDSLLLTTGGSELRFRHTLTRDAVLDSILPPRQHQLAASALKELMSVDPELGDGRRELAVDLALRAGDRHQAGSLMADAGRQYLGWGALATAIDVLRQATDLLGGTPRQADTELELVEALALSGRVDEAAAAGGRLISRLGVAADTARLRVEAHLRLAHAAVAACRWQMARHHLEQARPMVQTGWATERARIAVLEADVAMAADDHEAAHALAEGVLTAVDLEPAVRCHALEIVGRSRRSWDLPSARAAFEEALVTAQTADLPLWRLRALHELGTIDMFDHAGVDRLLEAHQAAGDMGALSTAAVLDLQLAAAFTCRWDLTACDAHARSAIAVADRLGLDQVRSKALAMLTGSAGMRADVAATERYAASTVAAGPEDPMLEGFCWGMRGMALLVSGAEDDAMDPWARGMAILGRLPHAEPAAIRALWPLLLASRGDRRAEAAVAEARRLGVAAFHLNRSMIGYAEAILAGRRGDVRQAKELRARADAGWTNCEGWSHLARLLAAPPAASDGWGDAAHWLATADRGFAEMDLPAMQHRCQDLLARLAHNPWSVMGVSRREADVLRLVAEGLPNKEIADRLHLSPRTVEKHVESLLRKSGTRSRTELVTRLLPATVPSHPPG